MLLLSPPMWGQSAPDAEARHTAGTRKTHFEPVLGAKRARAGKPWDFFCKTYLTKALFLRRFSHIVLLFPTERLTFFSESGIIKPEFGKSSIGVPN